MLRHVAITSSSLLMEVLRDPGSSVVVVVVVLLLVLVCDRLVDNVLVCGTELRGGTTIFGDRTPSADCQAIVNGLPLYTEPSDTAWTITI